MTDYALFVFWLFIFGGPALFAYGIYLLVRGGTRSPSEHNDNDIDLYEAAYGDVPNVERRG